jgi:flagellar protein FlaJ
MPRKTKPKEKMSEKKIAGPSLTVVKPLREEKRSFFSSWDWKTASAIAIGIAFVIFYINLSFFITNTQMFAALNGVAVAIALGIPVYIRYREYSRAKELEHMFPAFMRDITENINVGMSLPKAIHAATENDYGVLSPYVKEVAAKIDWGIPFEKVLTDFAAKTKSSVVGRAVKGIIEAHRSGGTINTVLHAMTVSVRELERIKKERATRVYSQMVTGYFIYFLFLGIMLAMAKLLIPILTFQLAGAAGAADISRLFTDTFRSLVVIQGIFAGLGIGKMSEGSITAGFKHAFVLTVIGYTTFVIF